MALPSGPNFEFHADRPVGMNIDLNELFSVRNRSVVITGGASGIGFAVASTLTDRGANVTLLDRDRQKLESAVQNLSGREGKIRGAPCDVKDSGSLRREFDSAASKQGGIDIVFANAGIGSELPGSPIVMLARYGSVSPHRCHPIARHHHACSNNSRTSVSDLIGRGLEASNGS